MFHHGVTAMHFHGGPVGDGPMHYHGLGLLHIFALSGSGAILAAGAVAAAASIAVARIRGRRSRTAPTA